MKLFVGACCAVWRCVCDNQLLPALLCVVLCAQGSHPDCPVALYGVRPCRCDVGVSYTAETPCSQYSMENQGHVTNRSNPNNRHHY